MYFEVKSLIMTELSDFPFVEVKYFDSLKEAEINYLRQIKNKEVIYATLEKITKVKKSTIRSYKK